MSPPKGNKKSPVEELIINAVLKRFKDPNYLYDMIDEDQVYGILDEYIENNKDTLINNGAVETAIIKRVDKIINSNNTIGNLDEYIKELITDYITRSDIKKLIIQELDKRRNAVIKLVVDDALGIK